MIHPLTNIEVNSFELAHPRVSEAIDGLRLAQLSDIHMGRWVKPSHVQQLARYVNDAGVDLVALTGDYVGYDKRDLARCADALATLTAPSYAVLGNHDHWTSTELAREAFLKSPILLLENANTAHGHRDGWLQIVGVDDLVTGHADVPRAFEGVPPNRFCLVLNHVPSLAPTCAQAGGHLILGGHTHNFQFNVPQLTNRLAGRMGATFFAGPYRHGDAYSYINRGLGSASWPWRLRAAPEITFFTLRRGHKPRLELREQQALDLREVA